MPFRICLWISPFVKLMMLLPVYACKVSQAINPKEAL